MSCHKTGRRVQYHKHGHNSTIFKLEAQNLGWTIPTHHTIQNQTKPNITKMALTQYFLKLAVHLHNILYKLYKTNYYQTNPNITKNGYKSVIFQAGSSKICTEVHINNTYTPWHAINVNIFIPLFIPILNFFKYFSSGFCARRGWIKFHEIFHRR